MKIRHVLFVVCLNIADDYRFMDAKLVRLLKASVPRHL